MVTTAYALLGIAGLLLLAGVATSFRSKVATYWLVAGAAVMGTAAGIAAANAMGGEISKQAYAAVRDAAAADVDTDAAVQWALADGRITASEFAQIDEIHEESAGRRIPVPNRTL